MNRLELLVYNWVKTNPKLKRRIVGSYQRLMSLVPLPRQVCRVPITSREKSFFGFHDKCPWSWDNSKLLSHRFDIPYRVTQPDDSLEVGYFQGPDFLSFVPVGRTLAWSWQKGANLQWFGKEGKILFNDFDGMGHVARIVDPTGRLCQTLPKAAAAVNPEGDYALSINFRRFERGLPGYGYVNGTDPDADLPLPSRRGSGLHVMQTGTQNTWELFTVADIAGVDPHPSMRGAFHFFSHCLFSPNGKRFVFFHRWLVDGNRLWTRMVSSDVRGTNVFIFPTDGMVSHVGWRDDDHILAYARVEGLGDGYYLFRDRSQTVTPLGRSWFSSDGHPQFSPEPDHRFVLTDTYPDRFRMQFLIVFDVLLNRRYNIARLHLPFKFLKELQVDLHPRWNRNGTMICFDAGFTGDRALCTLAVDLSTIDKFEI